MNHTRKRFDALPGAALCAAVTTSHTNCGQFHRLQESRISRRKQQPLLNQRPAPHQLNREDRDAARVMQPPMIEQISRRDAKAIPRCVRVMALGRWPTSKCNATCLSLHPHAVLVLQTTD